MAWVVDTSVLIDVFEDDPLFGARSARCLADHLSRGLLICPVSYAEFGPVCAGEESVAQDFLLRAGVNWLEPWTWKDTAQAFRLWHDHVCRKRSGGTVRRPIADILIGAFAYRYEGVLTRNVAEFRRLCPGLKVVSP
jgi:predicted nucleic acid-binding protein